MIIGLLGKKGSGKDTVADYLVSKYGFTKYAFADKIRDILKILFNFTDDDFLPENKEKIINEWNVSPRKALQLIGTEFGQEFIPTHMSEIMDDSNSSKDFWVKHFLIWYKQNLDKNIVISDVRFEHECNILNSLDSKIWKLVRETTIYGTESHILEEGIDTIKSIDNIIYNNLGIAELHSNIDVLIS